MEPEMRNIFLCIAITALFSTNALTTDMPPSELAQSLTTFSSSTFPDIAPDTLGYALLHGTPTVDARYRFEHVDQEPFTKDADASTLRT